MHTVGELLRIDGAHERPVRVAEPGDLLDAERLTQQVDIPRDEARAEVGDQVGVLLGAGSLERLDAGLVCGDLGRVVGRGIDAVDVGAELVVVNADDCIGAVRTPRVEADDVVALAQIVGDRAAVDGHAVDARGARPARVDDDHAFGLTARRRSAGDSHIDRLTRGVVMVDRHFERGALQVTVDLARQARLRTRPTRARRRPAPALRWWSSMPAARGRDHRLPARTMLLQARPGSRVSGEQADLVMAPRR